MTLKHSLSWTGDTLIEDILPADAKLSLPHSANCTDALEQLEKSRINNALVRNTAGGYVGVIASSTLLKLSAAQRLKPIEHYLERVTNICTPKCIAIDVGTRLKKTQAPYVLVVDSSGRLLNFLEPEDFLASAETDINRDLETTADSE